MNLKQLRVNSIAAMLVQCDEKGILPIITMEQVEEDLQDIAEKTGNSVSTEPAQLRYLGRISNMLHELLYAPTKR